MNFMNIPAIKNQQQTLIKRNFDKIYAHEAAHKRAGGALAGAIVIEKNAQGIPVGGHVSIKMPVLNPKNPKRTIDSANTVINSAMSPAGLLRRLKLLKRKLRDYKIKIIKD